MVLLGSVFSAVWIVIANSWQQTPAGHRLAQHGGLQRAEIVDFWAMVFNPSSAQRLIHVLLGAFVLGAFFVLSVSAYYLLRRRHERLARKAFTVALVVAALGSVALGVSGDTQARAVAVNQPPKLAAFEGHFHTGDQGTPLWLFGLPDPRTEQVRYGLAIPKLLSLLVHHDPNRPVVGLVRTPPADRPPVVVPFVTYHLMLAAGGYMLAVSLLGLWLLWRRRLFQQRWLLKLVVVSLVAPYVANEAGWVAAEVGRQPWVVYGLLRTRDAVSPNVPATHVAGSIALFSLLYVALFALWLLVVSQPSPSCAIRRSTVGARLLSSTTMGRGAVCDVGISRCRSPHSAGESSKSSLPKATGVGLARAGAQVPGLRRPRRPQRGAVAARAHQAPHGAYLGEQPVRRMGPAAAPALAAKQPPLEILGHAQQSRL
jgi:cytochrome d ubiquinol oxidase subunit I